MGNPAYAIIHIIDPTIGIIPIIFADNHPTEIATAGIHQTTLTTIILTTNIIGNAIILTIFIRPPIPTTQLVLCCLA